MCNEIAIIRPLRHIRQKVREENHMTARRQYIRRVVLVARDHPILQVLRQRVDAVEVVLFPLRWSRRPR